jgi:hypothetical protein
MNKDRIPVILSDTVLTKTESDSQIIVLAADKHLIYMTCAFIALLPTLSHAMFQLFYINVVKNRQFKQFFPLTQIKKRDIFIPLYDIPQEPPTENNHTTFEPESLLMRMQPYINTQLLWILQKEYQLPITMLQLTQSLLQEDDPKTLQLINRYSFGFPRASLLAHLELEDKNN